MGKGIDLTRQDAPLHAAVMDDFKDQLLIVCLKRLAGDGNTVSIPVAEVDATGGTMLAFSVNNGVFNFEIRRMS